MHASELKLPRGAGIASFRGAVAEPGLCPGYSGYTSTCAQRNLDEVKLTEAAGKTETKGTRPLTIPPVELTM